MTQLDRAINEMIAQRGYAYTCGFIQSQLRHVLEVWVDPMQRDSAISEIISLIEQLSSIHLIDTSSS